MVNTHGYRRGTRHLFARDFGTNGPTKLSTYMINYKIGDIVDIKCNASIHRGMPHKFYHGKTGRVFNVTPHAVGVVVNKLVGNRIMEKRVNLRIEHVQHSKCREDFLRRVKENERVKREAKAAGKKAPLLKRQPAQPRGAHYVSVAQNKPVTLTPQPYVIVA